MNEQNIIKPHLVKPMLEKVVFEKLGFHLAEKIDGGFELSDGSRQDRLVFRKDLLDDESENQ